MTRGPKRLTPAQEQQVERADVMHTRAHILELGVAALLSREETYLDSLKAAREVIDEAIDLREEAYRLQAISRNDHTKPKRKRGGRVAKKKGSK